MELKIERLTQQHISSVAELERVCFHEPWNEESLALLTGEGGVGFVAIAEGKTAAYGGMLCVLDEGQITNIAVAPDCRRQGMGRAVLTALEAYALENGIVLMSLEVRESNNGARELYLGSGWCECGRRRNFYRFPTEDAIIMTKALKE